MLCGGSVVLFDAPTGARPELLDRPVRPGDSDDGHLEMSPPFHRIEGRENLLVDEVAGGPEEDESVGVRNIHELLLRRTLSAFAHSRKPPTNALSFEQVSTPSGSFSRSFALPPPMAT